MKDLNKIKQRYIEAALSHSKYSANGEYRKANSAAKVLERIYREMENKNTDNTLLVELLDHRSLAVRGWAAAHLLGLRNNTLQAEKTLVNISLLEGENIEENLEIFSAKKTLKVWKERGYLKF